MYLLHNLSQSPQTNIIRPHRMREMRTIATDVSVAWCLSDMRMRPAKTAEHIEVLWRFLRPKEHCTRIRWESILYGEGIEGKDIRCSYRQITLATCCQRKSDAFTIL